MHYLVTGGCGFIGSHLVKNLLTHGHRVTVIDNLHNSRRENIPPDAHLVVADVTSPGVFDEVVAQVDGCFHLAAIVSVQHSTQEWLATHRVNQGGLIALYEALVKAKRVIPVVFASSAAVYGRCADPMLGETSDCVPLSPYGVDKRACELHAAIASHLYGIPTMSLRLFNVYGNNQGSILPYADVLTLFLKCIRDSLPVTIYGDGSQVRDFIHVLDVIKALRMGMDKLQTGAIRHDVLNVCTGHKTSVNDLIVLLSDCMGVSISTTHAPARHADIRTSVGDPRKAMEQLGLGPLLPIEKGLKMLLAGA